MFWRRHHPSDRELLLLSEDALSPARLHRAHRHVATCSPCQERMGVLQRTLAELTHACREHAPQPLPPMGPARARLEMQLTRLSEQPRLSLVPSYLGYGLPRRWLQALGIVVLSASGVFLYGRNAQLTSNDTSNAPRVLLLPIAHLTPGATRPVTLHELCSGTNNGSAPIVSGAVHQEVFHNYGTDARRAAEYELDHLITPELGGASDARNLWPQAYSHTPWNAYVKDELERLFYRLVCDGEIELATAQREMASDWISAYKQRFQTDKPLRDYATAPLTALDRDLLRSELEEFGISPPGSADGSALMVMLEAAREGGLREPGLITFR